VIFNLEMERCGSIIAKIAIVLAIFQAKETILVMIQSEILIVSVSDTHWYAHVMLRHWIMRVSGRAPTTLNRLRHGRRMKTAIPV